MLRVVIKAGFLVARKSAVESQNVELALDSCQMATARSIKVFDPKTNAMTITAY